MLVRSLLCAVALCVAMASAHFAAPGWTMSGVAVDPSAELSLVIAMSYRNIPLLESHLRQSSFPGSPNYGKHMSRRAVVELTRPSDDAMLAVEQFLKENSLKFEKSRDSSFFEVVAKAVDVEKIFSTTLRMFIHTSGLTSVKSINGYTIPAQIKPFVACVEGLTGLPRIPQEVNAVRGANKVTPAWLRDRYSVTVPSTSPSNLQAVVSFLEQYFSYTDLEKFFQQYEPEMSGMVPEQVVGFNNASFPGLEATLDIQFLMGITENIRTWVYYTPGTIANGNEPWLDWFATLESEEEIPWVLSMSYQDYEPTVDKDYALRVNDEFIKYTSMGYTFVTGSGDWGVGCQSDVCDRFTPDFPSSSPYVVSLGGTTILTAGEIGVSFSSGGFSDYFAAPSYQSSLVSKYLSDPSVPPTSFFNVSGRAFPDLCTMATDFAVVWFGFDYSVGGTSASTPTFASMLSLINSMRLTQGLPTLGWVNPLLYQAYDSGAFTDIVSCEPQESGCCKEAFSTTTGWDPMTGMGTPKFDVLATLAMSADLFN
ncbi:tripeptidyl-peptidase I [Pelomyxa schiedti]|nr:tripeptidyl-peptidase I [Pelomyxa schiedti]